MLRIFIGLAIAFVIGLVTPCSAGEGGQVLSPKGKELFDIVNFPEISVIDFREKIKKQYFDAATKEEVAKYIFGMALNGKTYFVQTLSLLETPLSKPYLKYLYCRGIDSNDARFRAYSLRLLAILDLESGTTAALILLNKHDMECLGDICDILSKAANEATWLVLQDVYKKIRDDEKYYEEKYILERVGIGKSWEERQKALSQQPKVKPDINAKDADPKAPPPAPSDK